MVTKVQIIAKLREIEGKEEVKILYAVESGSRGWGFESKDSDYDVRFIYIHDLDWYLSIEEGRDVIEYPVTGQLDLSGWDIKKALKLFQNSNPPLYEWLTSPIIYIKEGDFVEKLKELIPLFYSPVSSSHHYLSMAKKNYQAYLLKPKVKIKKYFYVMRPILACMWIEKYKIMPPMEFEKLLEGLNLNKNLVSEVRKLLLKKRSGEEMDLEEKVEIIQIFLKEKIAYFEDYVKRMGRKKYLNKDQLDKLFKETITGKDSLGH